MSKVKSTKTTTVSIPTIPSKQIVTYIKDEIAFKRLLQNNPGLLIIKLGATWCGPCKRIKPIIDSFFFQSPDNVLCCEIDIDESFEFYSILKRKRMVNGVPAILCYKNTNTSYIPDDSITGADPGLLDAFLKRCSIYQRMV